MNIKLRVLTPADVHAHNAGEDHETVRWLTGGYGAVEGTAAHFEMLPKTWSAVKDSEGLAYGSMTAGWRRTWTANPGISDGLNEGDVNVTYAVHPWARGRGVAVRAVGLICDFISERAADC